MFSNLKWPSISWRHHATLTSGRRKWRILPCIYYKIMPMVCFLLILLNVFFFHLFFIFCYPGQFAHIPRPTGLALRLRLACYCPTISDITLQDIGWYVQNNLYKYYVINTLRYVYPVSLIFIPFCTSQGYAIMTTRLQSLLYVYSGSQHAPRDTKSNHWVNLCSYLSWLLTLLYFSYGYNKLAERGILRSISTFYCTNILTNIIMIIVINNKINQTCYACYLP